MSTTERIAAMKLRKAMAPRLCRGGCGRHIPHPAMDTCDHCERRAYDRAQLGIVAATHGGKARQP